MKVGDSRRVFILVWIVRPSGTASDPNFCFEGEAGKAKGELVHCREFSLFGICGDDGRVCTSS
jgi:hypothetical protein